MAIIVGNITEKDDYPHQLGPEPNFNESMYFNFFDRKRRVGGFVRLGNRANEGRAEMTTTVFLADGRVLFNFDRPRIDNNDSFDAGGMRFEVLEPLERLRTSYLGTAVELSEPRQMADPRKAFAQNPRRHLAIDLEHRGVGPIYGNISDPSERDRAPEEQFAKAHYEQHMQVSGTIAIDGEEVAVDGYGLRDHSWGPRYWQALRSYEWLTMNFGDDFGAMVSIIRRGNDDTRIGGVVVRGDQADFVEAASIDADYEANGLYHTGLSVKLRTKGGEKLEIRGSVKSFIPLRNRRERMTTHVGEGMTEWRCGDRSGYGLSEFLRQV